MNDVRILTQNIRWESYDPVKTSSPSELASNLDTLGSFLEHYLVTDPYDFVALQEAKVVLEQLELSNSERLVPFQSIQSFYTYGTMKDEVCITFYDRSKYLMLLSYSQGIGRHINDGRVCLISAFRRVKDESVILFVNVHGPHGVKRIASHQSSPKEPHGVKRIASHQSSPKEPHGVKRIASHQSSPKESDTKSIPGPQKIREAIIRFCRDHPEVKPNMLVIVGDFNHKYPAEGLNGRDQRLMREVLGLDRNLYGADSQDRTCCARPPIPPSETTMRFGTFDWIFSSQPFKSSPSAIFRLTSSDHAGLVATIADGTRSSFTERAIEAPLSDIPLDLFVGGDSLSICRRFQEELDSIEELADSWEKVFSVERAVTVLLIDQCPEALPSSLIQHIIQSKLRTLQSIVEIADRDPKIYQILDQCLQNPSKDDPYRTLTLSHSELFKTIGIDPITAEKLAQHYAAVRQALLRLN